MRLLLTALLAAAASAALAQQPPVSSIRVTAQAQVSAKPDRVQIDIGVTTHAERSQAAAAANARQVQEVLEAVRKAAGSAATLQTVNYSLNPSYRYENGREPTLTGYDAANSVQVTLDELSRLPAVIDAAAQTGANNVRGIQFTLRDPSGPRAEALRRAATKARAEADVLAAALGLKVVRVLSVEELGGGGTVPVVRPRMMGGMVAAEAATPVESGSLDVGAGVQLTVEVAALH